jgi:hypothetical protein
MGTVRQGVLASAVAGGMSIADAGILAGYQHRQNADEAYRSIRTKMIEDLAQYGVTTAAIAAKIREKMDAKETKFFQSNGLITDAIDVEAHGIQLQATEMAADILGLRGRDDKGASIGTINILCHSANIPQWSGNQLDSNGILNGNESAMVGLSTIEGTGSDPGLAGPTHSDTQAKSTVSIRIEANKKSSGRTIKKRGPRLPVLGGRNKP